MNGIGTDGRRVVVSVFASPADLTRHLGPDVVRGAFAAIWFDATDPAVAAAPGAKNWATEQQLQYATCARLLNHPDAPAPAGQRLVPEVAAAPPIISPDGRTYTFRIRPGFRFSPPSNERVTAGTFKYSIERALSPRLGPGAPAASLASDIVGVGAYRAGRARHVAGIKANGDILSIALARPARDLPERIAASYFCPVPIGTPIVANGLEDPIPSAGPYYLSANQGGAVTVLKRNPNYRGPRPHRLDAIVFREQIPLGSTAARIKAGETDYAAENGPALAPDTALARRFGQTAAGQSRRYFRTPLLGTDELVLASRRGPLGSARVRRAINLALDRPALAAALGDLVTDRYLPPGMRGFANRHVYPLGGPDLRRARALINGRHLQARLAVCGEPGCLALGRAVRAELRRIGIEVRLRHYPGDIASRLRRPGADIVLARALAPYPDPVAFLRTALGDTIPSGRLDAIARLDRRRRLPAAGRLELSLLRHQAPAAAFGTPAIPEFFSTRVGCKTFPPVSFGVDLAALCLPRK